MPTARPSMIASMGVVEEIDANAVETARATGTAGSAVVFAGITVLIALIGLGFAGIPFLTTMGIAAAVAVAIAVLVSRARPTPLVRPRHAPGPDVGRR
jgi:uncharacterized membrane protein YdfJ with MMPL/SSD domain